METPVSGEAACAERVMLLPTADANPFAGAISETVGSRCTATEMEVLKLAPVALPAE